MAICLRCFKRSLKKWTNVFLDIFAFSSPAFCDLNFTSYIKLKSQGNLNSNRWSVSHFCTYIIYDLLALEKSPTDRMFEKHMFFRKRNSKVSSWKKKSQMSVHEKSSEKIVENIFWLFSQESEMRKSELKLFVNYSILWILFNCVFWINETEFFLSLNECRCCIHLWIVVILCDGVWWRTEGVEKKKSMKCSKCILLVGYRVKKQCCKSHILDWVMFLCADLSVGFLLCAVFTKLTWIYRIFIIHWFDGRWWYGGW